MLGFHQHSPSLELTQRLSSMREEVFIEEEIFKALLKQNNEIFFMNFHMEIIPNLKKGEKERNRIYR